MELSQIKSILNNLSIDQIVKLRELFSLEDQFMSELETTKNRKLKNGLFISDNLL